MLQGVEVRRDPMVSHNGCCIVMNTGDGRVVSYEGETICPDLIIRLMWMVRDERRLDDWAPVRIEMDPDAFGRLRSCMAAYEKPRDALHKLGTTAPTSELLWQVHDDALRAEVNRRWGEDDCPMAKTLRHERDQYRDKWTSEAEDHAACLSIAEGAPLDGFNATRPSHRAVLALRARCEAAEARVKSLDARIEEGYLPLITRLQTKTAAPINIACASGAIVNTRWKTVTNQNALQCVGCSYVLGFNRLEALASAGGHHIDHNCKSGAVIVCFGEPKGLDAYVTNQRGELFQGKAALESGPGIAKLPPQQPDNSVPFLLEDLVGGDV
jgi:hypothetical protein